MALSILKADGSRIAAVYSDTMDMLVEKGYKRPEAIAGLLTILAVQIVGDVPEMDQLDAYIKAVSEYTVLFFGDHYREGDQVH